MRYLTFAFLLFVHFSFAQRTIDVGSNNVNPLASNLFYTVGGTPFSPYKYVRVIEGSPYFNEGWMQGLVVLKGGTQYKNLLLKLDLLENEVHYLDNKGLELVAVNPISEIVLIDSVSGEQFHFVHSSALSTELPAIEKGWYEILQGGKAKLYKLHKKQLTESTPYGSATTEQRIETLPQYFVLNNKRFERVKKWKEITSLLNDKKAELEKHISQKNLTGKKDDDYISVVSYYNSLTAN